MRFMYFGTKRKMRWVKIDAPGREQITAGYSERLDYLNGGVGLRRSRSGHQEYMLTWNVMTREQARHVTDYAHGIYGDGFIYFVDPAATDLNLLNPAWAAPGIGAKDGVPLAGDTRPTLVDNPNLSLDYPVDMARYTLTAADRRRSFYVPIPPGFVAHVGAHGGASTLGIQIQPTQSGVASGAPLVAPVLPTSSAQRFSHSVVASGAQPGVEISIQPGDGEITLAGLMVQVVEAGTPASTGGFISGHGSSGCEFEGTPRSTPYRIADGTERVGLSVKLIETEDWA